MIPGEPLVDQVRPYRLPGVPHRDPYLRAVRRSLVACVCLLGAWLTAAWVTQDPFDPLTCIELPDVGYLTYRGLDGAWLFNNHLLGYTATEDDACLHPTPQR